MGVDVCWVERERAIECAGSIVGATEVPETLADFYVGRRQARVVASVDARKHILILCERGGVLALLFELRRAAHALVEGRTSRERKRKECEQENKNEGDGAPA